MFTRSPFLHGSSIEIKKANDGYFAVKVDLGSNFKQKNLPDMLALLNSVVENAKISPVPPARALSKG